MKIATVVAALCAAGMSTAVLADQYVQGYFRSDGTYIAPHYQTAPNNTKLDNYSTRGNVNPYTGQPGYKSPYYTTPKVAPAPRYEPYQYKPYKWNDK